MQYQFGQIMETTLTPKSILKSPSNPSKELSPKYCPIRHSPSVPKLQRALSGTRSNSNLRSNDGKSSTGKLSYKSGRSKSPHLNNTFDRLNDEISKSIQQLKKIGENSKPKKKSIKK
jgi:hypothetical protein